MNELYQATLAPNVYIFEVIQGDTGLDLSTVTAAVLKVRKPGASTWVDWTVSIQNQSVTSMELVHAFPASASSPAAASECELAGDYTIYAVLTVPTGVIQTERAKRKVRHRGEVLP